MTDPRAALGDGSRSTQLTFRRRWEDAAMKVVCAVKRDLVPDMDDNDGGQLLVWILDLCEQVGAAVPRAPRLEAVEKWRRRLAQPEQHWGPPDLLREIVADLEAARALREPLEPAIIVRGDVAELWCSRCRQHHQHRCVNGTQKAERFPSDEAIETPEEAAQEFADAGAEVFLLTVTEAVPFTRASGDLVSQPLAAARSALPPPQGVGPMPVLTFADYWRCRRCQTVFHSPTTRRPPGQCDGKALGSTSYGTCTNPMESGEWDAITDIQAELQAALPRVPEPDQLQGSAGGTRPDALLQSDQSTSTLLARLVKLEAAWRADASFNPRETSIGYSHGLTKCADALRAARAGAEAPPLDVVDEELVPHPFVPGEGGRGTVWCANCEYHQEHPIHARVSPPEAQP